jgi:hypothetical protein
MPRATKRAFARAVGKTFQIEAFDELGCAELDLSGKVGWDTIWIEPFCVQRFRRPKKQSLRFRKTVAMRRRLDRPRWSLGYVARYRPKDNPDRLIERLQTLRSKRRLEQLRKELRDNGLFLSLRLTGVRLSS